MYEGGCLTAERITGTESGEQECVDGCGSRRPGIVEKKLHGVPGCEKTSDPAGHGWIMNPGWNPFTF